MDMDFHSTFLFTQHFLKTLSSLTPTSTHSQVALPILSLHLLPLSQDFGKESVFFSMGMG